MIWTPEALQDRINIWNHISAENPAAAIRMDEMFSNAAERLATHPMIGKPGLITGTRELIIHESYRLVYETGGKGVWLLALVHTARCWPPVRD